MRDFNRNNYFGGRGRSFGNSRPFNNRGPRPSRSATMYPATCSKCGKECEVPFQPSGDKPVFCRDCYRENGGMDRNQNRRSDERNFSRSANTGSSETAALKQELAMLSRKVDKILEILTTAVTPSKTQEESVRTVEQPAPVKKKRSSSPKAL